jgi:hypothetical protein
MRHGTKSKNNQSNTNSFTSSGYSSQSLSEHENNNNKTSLNFTTNTDYRVRTSTPTNCHEYYNYSQQAEMNSQQTAYTINTLDCCNKIQDGRNKKNFLQKILSIFLKCLTCLNIFKTLPKKSSPPSPVHSIYDNFNVDLQKYYQEQNCIKVQNYYEYRPTAVYNSYKKGQSNNKMIHQNIRQQIPVTANYHYKVPLQQQHQNYYTDTCCNTRNSTFINCETRAALSQQVIKPYLSSTSMSSIESSVKKQQPYQYKKYPKSNSIDSVVPSSVSTSLSSLETAISCSSPTKPLNLACNYNNLKFISPIVNNNNNVYKNYDSVPNVMIQLEKMSLNRCYQKQQDYNSRFQQQQKNRQLPLLNPLFDDYLCDKEVEGYFENPVYFDCYKNEDIVNYYVTKSTKFKSESYC